MPTIQPDVDADGNIETPAGQAAEKKKNKNLTIAGVVLGGLGLAVVLYLHGKSSQSAGGNTSTGNSPPTTATTYFPGGDASYGGGDVLAGSSIFSTAQSNANQEFQSLQAALATIAQQNQAIGTYELGIGAQNQAIGTMLLNGRVPTNYGLTRYPNATRS